jgi:CRISPR-associated protein Csx14
LKTLPPETSDGLYSLRVPLSGRFGFDPGAAWNALDVGFSPSDQDMGVASSPAVELLAAVGLQRFRPSVERDRESFFYATWEKSLPPLVAAAAASGVTNISPGARFRGRVVSRGSYAALGMSTPL